METIVAQPEPKKPVVSPWVLLIIVVIALLGIGFAAKDKLFPKAKQERFQAVFLTNGQVYFGKLKSGDKYSVMTNIWYLQNGSSANQISLVKLGNELHGPMDKMEINNSQILIIEDLKSDSQVVQKILGK